MAISQTTAYAATYAHALLDLANQQKIAEQIGTELAAIRTVVTDNPTFAIFLRDKGVSSAKRAAMIKTVFGGSTHPLLMSFLGVVNEKGRTDGLTSICDVYQLLLDQQMGKVEIDVTVVSLLSGEDLEKVRREIGMALKQDAIVKQHVDPSILGGLIIKVGDQLIDGSVRSQLHTLRTRMLAAGK